MPEVKPIKRGRGRPPGAKNKPKSVFKEEWVPEPKKQPVDTGINSLHPSLRIAKELRRLAEETGFTLKRIYDDMCEAGVIEIQTLYLEIIIARKEIQKALDALDGKITAKRGTGAVQEPRAPVRNGVDTPGVPTPARMGGSGEGFGSGDPAETHEQPDSAFVERGLSTPPRAYSEGDDARVDPDFAGFEDPTVVETEPENEPEESEEEMEESKLE